jgi:hypothetical protein
LLEIGYFVTFLIDFPKGPKQLIFVTFGPIGLIQYGLFGPFGLQLWFLK